MAAQDNAEVRLAWREVAAAVFAARGITTGLWKVGVGLKFAALNAGPSMEEVLPAGVIAVEALVLTKAAEPGPLVYDAASVTGANAAAARPKAVRARAAKPAKARA
jgi:hypothetical protein